MVYVVMESYLLVNGDYTEPTEVAVFATQAEADAYVAEGNPLSRYLIEERPV